MNSKGKPMRRRTTIPTEQVELINGIYRQGKTIKEISNLLSLNHNILRYYIAEPRQRGSRPKQRRQYDEN